MVVKYTPDNSNLSVYSFNINAPTDMNNLDTCINDCAPQSQWSTELNPNYSLSSLIGTENYINANTCGSGVASTVASTAPDGLLSDITSRITATPEVTLNSEVII
jgi:hypothetical protein